MFTEKEGDEGFWRPQEFRDSENRTEGEIYNLFLLAPPDLKT